MNRRGFLRLLGLAPAAVVATKLPLPPAQQGDIITFTLAKKLTVPELLVDGGVPTGGFISVAPLLKGEIGRFNGGVRIIHHDRLPVDPVPLRLREWVEDQYREMVKRSLQFPWTSTPRS